MLDPIETLLLDSSDELTIDNNRRRSIAVVGVYS
jgi:hypothetical protein